MPLTASAGRRFHSTAPSLTRKAVTALSPPSTYARPASTTSGPSCSSISLGGDDTGRARTHATFRVTVLTATTPAGW
jgi:hypothetical protein